MIHHDWFSLFCLIAQNGYYYYLNKVDINAQTRKNPIDSITEKAIEWLNSIDFDQLDC